MVFLRVFSRAGVVPGRAAAAAAADPMSESVYKEQMRVRMPVVSYWQSISLLKRDKLVVMCVWCGGAVRLTAAPHNGG
ncbi:hypothetical protein JYU34_012363 [Plutella xylostella]|uniref:Uncharacterized protein n=1 Tax=Plutella xylostella TaxID=51655 RepID=A0ABQ7QB54_PLUXY|nr:hypothetical protein JYU34_012363 [Plutella xylostella]